MPMPVPRACLVLVVGALLLLGCSSSDPGASPSAPGRDAGSAPSEAGGPGEADSGQDAGGGPGTDGGAPDVGADALPPGTVSVGHLTDYMAKIADGAADHCTTANGHAYCAGSCSGTCAGSKADSTYSVATGVASPAFDGASTQVNVSAATTDTLEWVKLDPAAIGTGPYRDDTHFLWDFYFYPTTTTGVQAYEFDAFFGANGWWLMMGTQCDLATGNWNGWDQASGKWIPSSIEGCGSFFHLNQWNHIVMRFHRDPGPVGSATSYYYDGLEVNGTSYAWGLGGHTGSHNDWDDVVGAQVQQDLMASFSGTLSSYYDAFTFDISP